MVLKVIDSEIKQGLLVKKIASMKPPFTVEIVEGRHRSTEQNRLLWQWIGEIVKARGDVSTEEVRAEIKAWCGVPILLAENELFRERYLKIVKPLGMEEKLLLMQEPIALPVTSLMSVEQMTKMLDAVPRFYAQRFGIVLSDPPDRREPPLANSNDDERAA